MELEPVSTVRPVKARGLLLVGILLLGCGPSVQLARASGRLTPDSGRAEDLSLEYQRIEIKVRDQLVDAHVRQKFFNHGLSPVEATYTFPMPEGSSLSGFAVWHEGERVAGRIESRDVAEVTHNRLRRQGRVSALAEHDGGDLFRARISGIQPASEKRLEVQYSQKLAIDDGLVSLRFPLTHPDGPVAMKQLVISVDVEDGMPIGAAWSPSHDVDVHVDSAHRVLVSLEIGLTTPDRDFELFYTLAPPLSTFKLVTYRDDGEDGYFMLSVSPPPSTVPRLPKDVVMVVDRSGSMRGDKLVQTKRALAYCLGQMRSEDRFGLVSFSTEIRRQSRELIPASDENLDVAEDWIRKLEAVGGTDIDGAMQAGLGLLVGEGSSRPRYLIFLTDGEPTIGRTDPQAIIDAVAERNKTGVRIFTFGVGEASGSQLLSGISSQNHGESIRVATEERLETKLAHFFGKIVKPIYTNVKLDLGGLNVFAVHPRELSHFYQGRQLTVLGRYVGAQTGPAVLRAKVEGQSFEIKETLELSAVDHSFPQIRRLWARRHVDDLIDRQTNGVGSREVVDEIISLSREHVFVTPYTSFLAVPQQEMASNRIPVSEPAPPAPLEFPDLLASRQSGNKELVQAKSASELGIRAERSSNRLQDMISKATAEKLDARLAESGRDSFRKDFSVPSEVAPRRADELRERKRGLAESRQSAPSSGSLRNLNAQDLLADLVDGPSSFEPKPKPSRTRWQEGAGVQSDPAGGFGAGGFGAGGFGAGGFGAGGFGAGGFGAGGFGAGKDAGGLEAEENMARGYWSHEAAAGPGLANESEMDGSQTDRDMGDRDAADETLSTGMEDAPVGRSEWGDPQGDYGDDLGGDRGGDLEGDLEGDRGGDLEGDRGGDYGNGIGEGRGNGFGSGSFAPSPAGPDSIARIADFDKGLKGASATGESPRPSVRDYKSVDLNEGLDRIDGADPLYELSLEGAGNSRQVRIESQLTAQSGRAPYPGAADTAPPPPPLPLVAKPVALPRNSKSESGPSPKPIQERIADEGLNMDLQWRRQRQSVQALRQRIRRLMGTLEHLKQVAANPVTDLHRAIVEEVRVSPPVVRAGDLVSVSLTVRFPNAAGGRVRWRADRGWMRQARDGACLWMSPRVPGVYAIEASVTTAEGVRHIETIEVEVYQPARITYSPAVVSERAWLLSDAVSQLKAEAVRLKSLLDEVKNRAGLQVVQAAVETLETPQLEIVVGGSSIQARLAGCRASSPEWRIEGVQMTGQSRRDLDHVVDFVFQKDASWLVVTAQWAQPDGGYWLISVPASVGAAMSAATPGNMPTAVPAAMPVVVPAAVR